MRDIVYECWTEDILEDVFRTKVEAIRYAKRNGCTCVLKYDNDNFEPLGIVWGE